MKKKKKKRKRIHFSIRSLTFDHIFGEIAFDPREIRFGQNAAQFFAQHLKESRMLSARSKRKREMKSEGGRKK